MKGIGGFNNESTSTGRKMVDVSKNRAATRNALQRGFVGSALKVTLKRSHLVASILKNSQGPA